MYLLDDVLAAVDPPVAAWLVQHAICGPLLRHKTRVLCSHSAACAAAADQVVRMRAGCASLLPGAEAPPERSTANPEVLLPPPLPMLHELWIPLMVAPIVAKKI